MDIAQTVREILEQPDIDQARLGKMLGVSQPTIGRWAAGLVSPQGHHRDSINALHLSIFGDKPAMVRLVGFVGAGAAVFPLDDGGDEWVEAPPNASKSTTAVQIRGTSQMPAFEDGWILYYSKMLPPDQMINRRCVVHLADGRIMVKYIRRGSEAGLWTLTSTNDLDIEDVVLEWASPIDWIKPRE